MKEVNVTELRKKLPAYLGQVKAGEELLLTSRGRVIAKVVPIGDERNNARQQLAILRKKCRIGDVVSPLDEHWEIQK